MAKLEDLTPGAWVMGVLPDALVGIIEAKWHGSSVVELTYRDASGRLGSELLYRDREPTLEVAAAGRPWSFDGDGSLFRLVSEAHRIRLAHLFDPSRGLCDGIIDNAFTTITKEGADAVIVLTDSMLLDQRGQLLRPADGNLGEVDDETTLLGSSFLRTFARSRHSRRCAATEEALTGGVSRVRFRRR